MRSVKYDWKKFRQGETVKRSFFRAGCIQPGDRILRINQQSTTGLSLEEAVETMRESKPRVTLDVEFDVADSVVPASGVYWLKLVKPNGSSSSFGIALQGTTFFSFSYDVI